MASKFGDYLKKYKAGNHSQPSSFSTANHTQTTSTPSYSPLWAQIQSYLKLRQEQTQKKETKTTETNESNITNETIEIPATESRNLGILFIIIDEFPNEVLWRLWLSELEEGQRGDDDDVHDNAVVRVWIHAKFPERVTSDWVRKRLAKSFHLQPKWGSLDLTRVMLGLVNEAVVEAPEIKRFVFASESCLPITPLSTAMDRLYSQDDSSSSSSAVVKSWMFAKNTANNGFAQQKQFDVIEARIPKRFVWKADQWVMISRDHSLEIIRLCTYLEERRHSEQSGSAITNKPSSRERQRQRHITENPIFDLFAGTNASDELFFPTLLSLIGYEAASSSSSSLETKDKQILRRRVTYADWTENGNSPKSFAPFNAEDFVEAKEEGTIFFRKMKCQSFLNSEVRLEEKLHTVSQWLSILYDERSRGVFSTGREKEDGGGVSEGNRLGMQSQLNSARLLFSELLTSHGMSNSSSNNNTEERRAKKPRI